jgi:hypothetical protein
VHRIVFGLWVLGRPGFDLITLGRALAVPLAEHAGRLEDGRTPDRDAKGAALDGGRRQGGVPDAQVYILDADA